MADTHEALEGLDFPTPQRVIARNCAEIKPEQIRWLWKPRIPLGSITLLAGRQGLGKSTLTADLAAAVTRGDLDGDVSRPCGVLILSYEDHAATTLVPRLMAAGADLKKVDVLDVLLPEDGLVTLPGDLAEIEGIARDKWSKLLIIDPIVASLPSTIDAHRDQDVRRAMAPLAKLAADCQLAALGLIHWNKGASTDAITRISGSTGFSAAARSVLAFGINGKDADAEASGKRILAQAKTNLGAQACSIEYQLEGVKLDESGIETVRIRKIGETSIGASQLLLISETIATNSRLDEAVAFLQDELADGRWHSKQEIVDRAKGERISRNTLLRAFNQLGGEFDRRGFPAKAVWRLPKPVPANQPKLPGLDAPVDPSLGQL